MYEAHLEKRNHFKNQYRSYRLSIVPNLFGEWTLYKQWRRIGTKGRTQTEWHKTQKQARAAMLDVQKQKQRRGYGLHSTQLELFALL